MPAQLLHSRYSLPVIAVLLTLVLRWQFDPMLGPNGPLMVFIPAVALSAWFGGFVPGMVATILSIVAGEWFFLSHYPPAFLLVEPVRPVLFLTFGYLVSYAQEGRERTRREVQAVLASMTDAYCTLDRQLRFRFLNAQAEQLLGRSASDLRESRLREDAGVLAGAVPHCQAAIASGQPEQWEVHHAGGDAWFHCKAYPTPSGLSLCWRDITEQKRAEQRLQQTNEMLDAIVRASPVPIVALTTDWKVRLWNQAAERVFGWAEEEVIGQSIPSIPVSGVSEHEAMRARNLAGLEFGDKEVRRHHKNGDPIDLILSTGLIRDESGAVQGVVVVYLDITERKQAEEQVRQREIQMRLITDALPVSVAYVDRNFRYLFSNRRHREFWSRGGQAVIGQGLRDLLGPTDYPEMAERMHLALGGETVVFDWSSAHQDGRPMLARVSYVPDRRDDEETVPGVVVVVEDITRLKQDEQALREANQKLERANEDLRQFAYAASHDLQEPLRTVVSYSQLLTRRHRAQLDGSALEFLDFIVNGADRMSRMLQALRNYWQAGASEEPVTAVDCGKALHLAMLHLEVAIQSNAATITHDALPPVMAHEVALVQLWQNLLSNAIKYRRDVPPCIHISAVPHEDGCLFTVADNGIGIPKDGLQRVFGVFKRLHGREYPGTGIGLAMCSKIVERYGGQMWCESEVGQGTRFYLTLPTAPVTMQHALEGGR